MKNALKTTLGALAFAAMTAVSASAATVAVNSTPDLAALAVAGTTALPAGATSSTPLATVMGSVGGQYRSPFEALGAAAATISYFTIGTPSIGASASPEILTFSMLQKSFEMLWGSVDTYNTLKFYNGASLAFTLTGGTAPAPAAPQTGAVYLTVTDILFDKVEFSSTNAALEFSNLKTTAVPVPAAGFLLLGALGGLAALRRRKAA